MSGMMSRAGWIVAGALALLVVAALAGVVTGGPLDPPGAPAPTGKTLDQIPGSWDRKLAADDGVGGGSGVQLDALSVRRAWRPRSRDRPRLAA